MKKKFIGYPAVPQDDAGYYYKAADVDARDADRLNWLEKMARQPGGLLLHSEVESTGRAGLGLAKRSLRKAIDDAMGEQQQGK